MSNPHKPLIGWKAWGENHCDHCCNGDRCDDHSHKSRENCPYCLGTGRAIWLENQEEKLEAEMKS